MPKYQVWLDKGVKLGGKRFPHGALVDSDDVLGKPEAVAPLVPNATEEQKAAHKEETDKRKIEHDEKSKQAKTDLDAAVKLGHLAAPAPVPEEKKNDTKKKEG